MKTRQLILAWLLAYLLPIAAQADGQTLQTDADGYYLLSSADDWKAFAAIAEETPNVNARMTADIDLGDDQTMIGSVVSYQGVFNGQGHTLTVAYSNAEGSIAPFRYVEGATIEDLHVTGRIESYYVNVGGIAAIVRGDVTTVIRNCWSSSHLISGTGGIGNTIGGIASDNMGILVIEDCLFDGSFAEKNRYYNAGFVPNNWNSLTIRNSLNIGSYYSGGGTFYRTDVSTSYSSVTLDNVYYKNANGGVAQGTAVTDEQLADGTVVALLQNGRTKEIWTQGATPVLSFSDYADQQSPVLLNSVPQNGEVGVPITGSIMLTFDKYVRVSQSVAFNGKDLVPSVNGKTVVFEYFGLAYNQNYTFVIPANSVMDLDGNYVTEDIRLTFTTSELPANALLPFGQFSNMPWLAKNMQNPPDDWYQYGFDDSEWGTVVGPMARDGMWYSNTRFPYAGSYWFRRHFTMNDVDASQQYVLYVSHDDDCVVWLNGTEVLRENFYHVTSDNIWNWVSTVVIDGNLLKEGDNVLAVYVHDVGGAAFIDCGLYTDADVFIEQKGELVLELSPKHIEEGANQPVKLKLTRTVGWAQEETFMLTATTDSRVTVPATITIPARQSAAVIDLPIKDNDVLDADSIVEIMAMGDGYETVKTQLIIEDDDYPALTVKSSKSTVSEGETFQLTISTSEAVHKPLTVTLTCENPRRFTCPMQATIPAGQKSVKIDVTAKDDDIPSETLSNAFTVSASRYENSEVIVLLEDDDMPVLELTILPNKVQEGAGPVSVAGILRRTGVTNNKITVRMSDDSNSGLYFGHRELVLQKGVEEVNFNFGPIDNAQVDGNRTYTVTAAVWLSSCNCSAAGESAGSVSAQLEVFDDDGPALTLASTMITIKEGGKTMLTVGRNTLVSLDQSLTVHLSSNYDDNLSYEHTVIIPAGQQTIEVEITSNKNDVSGDTHIAVFTVQSEGFASATCYLMVTDQTLPDAVISSIVVNKTEIEAGNDVLVSLIITNAGISVLPAGIEVSLYADTYQRTIKTHKPLEVGESTELKADLTMPLTIGRAKCYAIINERMIEHELSYNNNTSQIIFVSTVAPYKAALSTDKSIYCQGENVIINGSLTGQIDTEQTVEVYFIHEGNRFVQNTMTDKEGNFILNWEPFQGMYGKVSIGACYEGEKLNKEMASVNIIGLKLSDDEPLLLQPIVGEKHKGEIEIKNPVALKQTGISVETITKPNNIDVSFDIENNINSEGAALLKYSITPLSATQGTDWQKVELKVTSNEGASLDITIRVYARNAVATLISSESKIKTTVTKGVVSNYSLTLTNTGNGETGIIALSLPEWISCAMGNTLPSIPKNGVMDIMLLINPTEEMSLNKPRKGVVGINCQNGNGIAIDYEITPVESAIGTLIIDAVDTYTYNTPEAPHVSGAKVDLLMPVSKEIVATGITDEDGLYKVDLPAGNYQMEITTLKHDKYAREIYVAPSTDNSVLAILQYEPITVNWSVSETEVEDEYAIVNTIEYETNVPMPVIILDVPERIAADQLAEGESLIFNAIITNKGLIAGKNTSLLLSEHPLFTIETLAKDRELTIAPQQSITIPIKVTRRTLSQNNGKRSITIAGIEVDCGFRIETLSYYDCGVDGQMYLCQKSILFFGCDITDHNKYTIPTFPRDTVIPPPPPVPPFVIIVEKEDTIVPPPLLIYRCEPCQNTKLLKIVEFGTSWLPYLSVPAGAASWFGEHYVDGKRDAWHYVNGSNTLLNSGKRIIPMIWKGSEKVVKKFWILNILNILYQYSEPCNLGKDKINGKRKTSEISYLTAFEEKLKIPIDELEAYRDYLMELFGNESLAEEADYDSQQYLFDGIVASANEYYHTEELQPYKPSHVSDEIFSKFIERLNNTTHIANGEQVEGNNYIHYDVISDCVRRINQAEYEAVQLGYSSTEDMLTKEFESVYEKLQEQSNSICASITLKFSQTMNLTRPAYRGTLEVFNGHDEIPMQDVKMNLVIRDENGIIATAHEFQINAESLDGFEGELDLSSGWTLEAQKTGTATVLFIPTKYAAPTEPMKYSFGGTLTYIDPFTGLEVTRDLFPVTLTVNPSPDLELTYLMQRDVYGDDPLTEDVVEPMEPAEFALIINNKGNGEAKNVRMVTEQPKITDNEKGLLIDFNIVSSQVNGAPATLSLGKTIANDFGTINAQSQAYAQWWLESTLLGHFTSYEVAANHVTSYGNQDLSLIDTVTIHEMVHGFTVDAQRRGYLVNDILDADDLPDVVYLTDATQLPLHITTEANISSTTSTTYRLIVTPSQAGWNYGSLTDPTNGKQRIIGIKRQSDGAVIPTDNVWQTDRTLRDGRDWLYENRIHFVVEMNSGEESYMLYFEVRPDVELAVEQFIGVPTADTVLEEPLDEVTVRFNKPIKAESFTTDDLTLYCQGVKQNARAIVITQKNNTDYTLGLSKVNRQDGYFVLTVQTAGITDDEGFNGVDGKTASWIQFLTADYGHNFDLVITSAGYATFYDSQWNYQLPSELKAYVITGEDDHKLVYRALADDVVPQGVAVLIESNPLQEGIFTLTSTETAKVYNGQNLLRGTDEATIVPLYDNEYAYKLAYGSAGTEWNHVLGWFWGTEDGGAFYIDGHKAWLVVPKKEGTQTRAFLINGEAISDYDNMPKPESRIYDLQGRRVVRPVVKGIYIKDGHKITIK